VCHREEGKEKAREKRDVFSLDLNTVTESLLMTVSGGLMGPKKLHNTPYDEAEHYVFLKVMGPTL